MSLGVFGAGANGFLLFFAAYWEEGLFEVGEAGGRRMATGLEILGGR